MTEWDDRIIVLRLGLFHEADVWLRALSRQRGILTLFAFGGAKSVRRFCGCLDKFNTLQCRIKASGNGYLNLLETELVKAPVRLRRDWRGMGAADNCIHFMEAMRVDHDSSKAAFALLEDLRESLEKWREPRRLTTFFFRLNLASLLGFAPDLEKCASCGTSGKMNYLFVPEEGRIFCPRCLGRLEDGQKRHGINAPFPVLSRLGAVRFSPPHEWREDDLLESEKRACARLVDCFIRFHLGIGWDNGRFRSV